jgi:hypothetical protein
MQHKSITIQIDLDSTAFRLLFILLICMTLGGSVAYAGESLAPSQTVSTAFAGRQYYLTSSTHLGNQVLSACETGYHAASLWEIYDVSNLAYNTTLGYAHFPGDGTPPTNVWGWARTGDVASIGSNCGIWSFAAAGHFGTVIAMPNNWSTPGSTMGAWKTDTRECNVITRVWCVEN